MSRRCQIIGKGPSSGKNRSHACNATNRIFNVNLTKKKVVDPATGRMKRMKVSMSALRTMDKKLIAA